VNPYSQLKNALPLNNQSQGDLSYLYLLVSALESAYSSGFTGDRPPGRYLVEQLEAAHDPNTPAIVRIRTSLQTAGQLD
jgi:hypothetical protein